MTYKTKKSKRRKVLRYRVIDVGRTGHHYLLIAVKKGKGKRGGRTEAELVRYKKHRKRGESPFLKA